MADFKVGDIVIYIPTKRKYEIVGDKNKPVKHFLVGKIYPSGDCDFILAPVRITADPKVIPYVHSPKELIRPLDSYQ
jgi:hypothetical protein